MRKFKRTTADRNLEYRQLGLHYFVFCFVVVSLEREKVWIFRGNVEWVALARVRTVREIIIVGRQNIKFHIFLTEIDTQRGAPGFLLIPNLRKRALNKKKMNIFSDVYDTKEHRAILPKYSFMWNQFLPQKVEA